MIHTRIAVIDGDNIDQDVIDYGAQLIRAGELVAFPTETACLLYTSWQGDEVYKDRYTYGRRYCNT